jgi:hypothetical protein
MPLFKKTKSLYYVSGVTFYESDSKRLYSTDANDKVNYLLVTSSVDGLYSDNASKDKVKIQVVAGGALGIASATVGDVRTYTITVTGTTTLSDVQAAIDLDASATDESDYAIESDVQGDGSKIISTLALTFLNDGYWSTETDNPTVNYITSAASFPALTAGSVVSNIFGNATLISGSPSLISGNVTNIRGSVSALSGSVSGLEGFVGNISGNVSNIVGDVSLLSGGVSNISCKNAKYTFTITAPASPVFAAAVYTNNSQSFTVKKTVLGAATSIVCIGTGDPLASGTLTISSGSGPSTLTFGSFSKIAADISIYGKVTTLSGDVSLLSGDVSGITGSVAGIIGSVTNLKGSVTNLKGDVSNISGTVKGLSGDVSNISGSVTNISGKVENCTIFPAKLADNTTDNPAYDLASGKSLTGDVSNLSGDLTGIYGVATGYYGNINEIGLTSAQRLYGIDIADLD